MSKTVQFIKSNIAWGLGILAAGALPYLGFIFSDKIIYASDQMGSMGVKWIFDSFKEGVFPLWSPYILGGMPTLDAMAGDLAYPPLWLLGMFFTPERLISWMFFSHVILAGVFSFILVRRYFGLHKAWCLLFSMCYMLNTNFISLIYGGHTGKVYVMAWLPLGLLFLFRSLDPGARWFHLLGTSLTVWAYLLTSHIQFTYFVLMGYFLYWCFRVYQPLAGRHFKQAAGAAVRFWVPVLLGIGLNFTIFYPPYMYNQSQSVRGGADKQTYEHATSWSLHPEEIASLAVPEFAGITQKYWGRNPFKGNAEYSGGLILALAVIALFAVRSPPVFFWGGVALLAIIFSLGANTPLFHIFYKFIPGVKSFRAPSMIIFWYVTAVWLMGIYTVQWLGTAGKKPNPQKFLKIGLGVCGAFLAAAFLPSTVYDIWNGIFSPQSSRNFANLKANFGDFTAGALRSAVVFAAAVACVWYMLKGKYSLRTMVVILFSVAYIDLFLVNTHFIETYNVSDYFPPDPVYGILQADKEKFRVFSIPKQGFPPVYNRSYMVYKGLEIADGFVDNALSSYRDFTGGSDMPNQNLMTGLRQNADGTVSGSAFLDLMNVKYLMYWGGDRRRGAVLNKSFLPRAWFVTDWEFVEDESILNRLKEPGLDLRRKVFVSALSRDAVPPPVPSALPVSVPAAADSAGADSASAVPAAAAAAAPPAAKADIREEKRTANELIYQIKAEKAGLLVVSEVWFPFWKVLVDGKTQPLLRVNYITRGVFLEPGDHSVRFVYDSPWLRRGAVVSAASFAVLLAFLFGFHFYSRRRQAEG